MTLGDHIEELRKRLIYILLGVGIGIIFSLFFTKEIVGFLTGPYMSIMADKGMVAGMQSLAPADGFLAVVKIAVISGIVFSCPHTFYQLWSFFSTGLVHKEKKFIVYAVPGSSLFFALGVIFFVFVVAPNMLNFFIIFNQEYLKITSTFTINKYLNFMTNLMIVFGVAFQTPVFVFIINKLGLVSYCRLVKIRKYIFLSVFIVSAVLTPPDVISQIALGVPLYILYEIGIFLCFLNKYGS